MTLKVILLSAIACSCTYAAAWRVLFRDQWERETLAFLRKKFGGKLTDDEELVRDFWSVSVPLWIVTAAVFWIWLAFELGDAMHNV